MFLSIYLIQHKVSLDVESLLGSCTYGAEMNFLYVIVELNVQQDVILW